MNIIDNYIILSFDNKYYICYKRLKIEGNYVKGILTNINDVSKFYIIQDHQSYFTTEIYEEDDKSFYEEYKNAFIKIPKKDILKYLI
jgi:hypothetical protein